MIPPNFSDENESIRNKPSEQPIVFELIILAFIILQIVTSLMGLTVSITSSEKSDTCALRGKLNYVAPGFYVGCKVGVWLVE
jgi:hypothetical protein